MNKDLGKRLGEALEEQVPAVNVTVEQAVLITMATLHVAADFSSVHLRFNRASLLRHARDILESLLGV